MDKQGITWVKENLLTLLNKELVVLENGNLLSYQGVPPFCYGDTITEEDLHNTRRLLMRLIKKIDCIAKENLNYWKITRTLVKQRVEIMDSEEATQTWRFLTRQELLFDGLNCKKASLFFNVLIDKAMRELETSFRKALIPFYPESLSLAIVAYNNEGDYLFDFLLTELEKKKTDKARRKFLTALSRSLTEQKHSFFNNTTNSEFDHHIKFFTPGVHGDDAFHRVKLDLRVFEAWIDGQLKLITPRLILSAPVVKDDDRNGYKDLIKRLGKILTSHHREINLDPIISIDLQKGDGHVNITNPETFKQNSIRINNPKKFGAIILWLVKEGVVKNEPTELVAWFETVGLRKYSERAVYYKKDNLKLLNKELSIKEQAYLRRKIAVVQN